MSGRAGRRGKDDRGIVIQMLDQKMEPDVAKGMIYGASDPLHSSYKVQYILYVCIEQVQYVCMYVYKYAYMYLCMYVGMYVCICMSISMCIKCMYVRMYEDKPVCISMYVHTCMCRVGRKNGQEGMANNWRFIC